MSDLTDAIVEERVTRAYIAGPITGNGSYREHFKHAAEVLRRLGLSVVSPVELDDADGVEGGDVQDSGLWAKCLARDLERIVADKVDVLVVLPDWEDSAGARVEVAFAAGAGIPVFTLAGAPVDPPTFYFNGAEAELEGNPELEESVLEEAQRIVGGSRGSDYGHPFYDFGRTARFATVMLESKLKPGMTIQPEDIPLLMIAVKLSRQLNHPKRDNLTDIAGYTLTAAMVEEKRGELENERGAALAEDLAGGWKSDA
jgi:hypothetical protein